MDEGNIVCSKCGCRLRNSRAILVSHCKKHSQSPLEVERIVVNSIYGKDRVENTVADYIAEKFPASKCPIDIIKYLKLLGVKRTSSQERHTARYRENYASSIFNKYGVSNISKSDIVKRAKKDTLTKHYGSFEKYIEDRVGALKKGYECYKSDKGRISNTHSKIKSTLKNRYGCENPGQIDEVRKVISEKAKSRAKNMTKEELSAMTFSARKAIPHRLDKATKLEIIILNAIRSIGYDCIDHKRFGRFSIDLVIESEKIAIEVNGDVYHANPKMYSPEDIPIGRNTAKAIWERDLRKKIAVEDAGYRLVTFWEDDIRRNKENIIEFVRRSIEDVKI